MRKYNLLTTWKFTNRLPDRINIDYCELKKGNIWRNIVSIIKLLTKLRKYDAYLAANPGFLILFICFLSKYLFFSKTLNVAFDILLVRPENLKHKSLAFVEQILFLGIDKFFCNHKDTRGYEKYYKIDKNKFYYVAWKANNYDILSKFHPKDNGYLLACGASHRDYETFIKATAALGYPTKIALPKKDVAMYHQSILNEKECPKNISIVRHDFDSNTWNELIAGAKIVVIPIKKGTLQSAGISVYLEAMALGKPVVITEGVSTFGIITNNEAEIVPPSDPVSLGNAIRKLWDNRGYRERLANDGKQFALSLENAERMIRDILKGICLFLEYSDIAQ